MTFSNPARCTTSQGVVTSPRVRRCFVQSAGLACSRSANARLVLALAGGLLLLAGCSSNSTPEGSTEPAGSGTISGSVDGRSFDDVAAAYIIGKPDDPASTVVIYVFDTAISCSEIERAGWDETVADQSQAIEMKLIGKSPGDYPVAGGGLPAAGEADVNYTVTSSTMTPSEVSATAGTVGLVEIDGTRSASGDFDLTIPGGSLTGSFSAAICAGGREP